MNCINPQWWLPLIKIKKEKEGGKHQRKTRKHLGRITHGCRQNDKTKTPVCVEVNTICRASQNWKEKKKKKTLTSKLLVRQAWRTHSPSDTSGGRTLVHTGAAPLGPRTISRPCPPAQPSPLCRLLFLQQCPLYEPAYQLSGLPPDASSRSEPGPPVSWRTNTRRKNKMSRWPRKNAEPCNEMSWFYFIRWRSSGEVIT